MSSPKRDSSLIFDPPSDAEIQAYGEWLGLSPEDKDLFWIPKQALETPIPSPWVECQTEAGDIFYFNSKTKESIWDHPFDSFYKRAIGRFKNGECTKEELTTMLSEEWLQSGVDHRQSSLDGSPQFVMEVNSGSTSRRRSFEGESPHVVVTLPVDPPPPEHASPSGARRRPSLTGSDLIREGNKKEQQNEQSELGNLKAGHRKEIDQLTSDLIKASEYIEILRGDNRGMRARMTEASVRAKDLQKDYLVTKQKLVDQTRKLEIAEEVIKELDARLLHYEEPDDSPSNKNAQKSQHILARLCGSSTSSSAVRRRPPTRTSPNVSRAASRPGNQSPPQQTARDSDPYRDLMQLLSSPPPSPVKP